MTNRIKTVSGSIKLYKKLENIYLPWFLDITVDCCESLHNDNYRKRGDVALNFIIKIIRDIYPSVFTGCPFEVWISS